MAKKKHHKKGKKSAKKRDGQIPLHILENRLVNLGSIVEKRGGDYHVEAD